MAQFKTDLEDIYFNLFKVNNVQDHTEDYGVDDLKDVISQFNKFTENEINFEASNSSELQDYFKIDISAIYNFKLGNNTKADLGASIWNLFNRKNQINNFFRVNNGTVDETLQTSLGFYPNVLARVYF